MLWYKKSFSEKKAASTLSYHSWRGLSHSVDHSVYITLFLNSKHELNNDVMVMGYIW